MGKMRFLLLALAGLALLLWPGGVDTLAAGPGAGYTATLAGGEEVPPRATPASGEVAIQVSADGQSLTYTVTVRDITNVLYGHIHLAPRGQNGDIVLTLVPMVPPGGGPRSGVIGQGTATAAQLTGPLQGKTLAELVAEMDAGRTYVNIHTSAGGTAATLQPGDIPPGELRGQLVLAPTPPTAATAPAATATRAGTATVTAAATATRAGTATVTAAATATQAVVATVPPTAPPPLPTTLPRTGGGYEALGAVLPGMALIALLTLGIALAVRRRRRI